MNRVIAAIICASAIASVNVGDVQANTVDMQKMEFLQNARLEAQEELEQFETKEANEQAELAIKFNMACMERAQQAKELEKLAQTLAQQKAAIAEQGARYQEHMNAIDTSAFFVSTTTEELNTVQLNKDINLKFNVGSNDGYARPYEEIFTKTALPATWDTDYYDVAIPYNLTCAEVGGIAIDVESKKEKYRYTAEEYKDRYVGSRIQQEHLHLPINIAGRDRDIIEDNYGVETYLWKGKQLYAIALPAQLFPEALTQQGFYPFESFKKIGILADLILTDGTIVNCVIIDGIGKGHSNGMCEGWTASSISTAQDKVRYFLSPMKYPQYSTFFHAASCHTVELSGDVNAFREEYGFDKNIRISYIRIYKYSFLEE